MGGDIPTEIGKLESIENLDLRECLTYLFFNITLSILFLLITCYFFTITFIRITIKIQCKKK